MGLETKEPDLPIVISFPNMGWTKYPFLSLFRGIENVEVFNPPPVNRIMIETGVQLSPEFVCFPFKVTLGEMIYLIEKHDIRHLMFPIDKGPCRMGFYAHVQEKIMRDKGYDFETIVVQQDSLFPETDWLNPFFELEKLTGNKISKLKIVMNVIRFLLKAKYIEELTELSCILRCRERRKGDTNRIVEFLLKSLDKEESLIGLLRFGTFMKRAFRKMPINRDMKPLRVVISGEIHVLLEHFVNFDIFRRMGDMGIEVHPTFGVYDWLLHKMHINVRRRKLEEIARAYIPLDIGGEAQWDMGAYIECQKNGFDGMVLVYPFTCMPEVTVRGIIEAGHPAPFYMPALYFSFDESSAYEGIRTRLEAFIDVMNTNRENDPRFHNRYEEPPIIAEIYDETPKTVRFKNVIKRILHPWRINRFINDFREIPNDLLLKYYLGLKNS